MNPNQITLISVMVIATILATCGIALAVLLKGPSQTHPCAQESGRNDPRCIGWYTRH